MTLKERGILVHPEELTEGWLERMREAGLNTLGLHPAGGSRAHLTLESAVEGHTSARMRSLRARAKELGIFITYEAHAMRYLMPSSLFGAHPAWFRMDERGQRVPDFNFCPSNPEALEYLSERAGQLAAKLDTGTDLFAFWLDDVAGRTCHCPLCQRLTPSDQQLIIVNAMLKGLRRRNPQARLSYLAYHDALKPPRNVEPTEGVYLELAPIDRDHHRPMPEQGYGETIKALIGFFGAKDAKVLEYWMDNSLYSGWKKPPRPFALDEDVMRRDVEYYLSMGFERLTSFGCYLGEDYEALYGLAPIEQYGRILHGG